MTRTAEAAPNRRSPIEDAKEWLRNCTGVGATERVVRRLLLKAEELVRRVEHLERELQKAQARVVELEGDVGSSESLDYGGEGT